METLREVHEYTCEYDPFSIRKKYLIDNAKIHNMYNYRSLRNYVLSKGDLYFSDEDDFDNWFYTIMYDLRFTTGKSRLKSLCIFLSYCGFGSTIIQKTLSIDKIISLKCQNRITINQRLKSYNTIKQKVR